MCKPEKYQFGFLYNPKNNSKFSFAFETTKKIWNTNIWGLKESINEYRLGFEYTSIKSFPIRAGLIYSESRFLGLDPKTTITLGTGKDFGRINLDVALTYNSFKYKYYDLFPFDVFDGLSCDDLFNNCYNIKENKLGLLSTIKIDF